MSICERAAVIGLGLVGGSVARDLRALGVRISAYDADVVALEAAVDAGVVDCPLDASLADVQTAEAIIVAVPPDAALRVLDCLAPHVGAARLITDVGSTKARIVERATMLGLGATFVGSHPMSGDHRSGWSSSRAGLFEAARVYLCPTEESTSDARERAAGMWHALGARPLIIDAVEHDRRLAWASHLPHVLAAALGLAMERGGIRRHDLGPGGRDMTRLAGSSPELWTAIARDNATALDDALAAAERELADFRAALGQSGDTELRRRFTAARRWFDE